MNVAVERARWLAELCEMTPIKALLHKRWHTNSIKFVNYLLFLTFQSLKSKFVKPFEKLSDTKRVLGIRTQEQTLYNCAVWGENLRITKAFQLLAWWQSQVQWVSLSHLSKTEDSRTGHMKSFSGLCTCTCICANITHTTLAHVQKIH